MAKYLKIRAPSVKRMLTRHDLGTVIPDLATCATISQTDHSYCQAKCGLAPVVSGQLGDEWTHETGHAKHWSPVFGGLASAFVMCPAGAVLRLDSADC